MPEDNHATIQALLNATADAVILIDLQGTLLALNDEAARRRGSTKAGLLGANLYATLAPELREGRRSAVEKIARTGQPVTLEERHGDRFFHVSMYPVLDEAGAVVQIASYSHDRTDAFRREAELVLAKEAAEAANMAKTQFLSNMSHELRTPLNGILGIAQIGKAEDVSPDTREMFQIIQESGMKLLRELNNLIDLASMERRSIEPLAREFRLNDLLEMVCRSYRVQAGLNGTDLRLETTCRLPELVVGDEYRLSQILSHLLSNALRFTHEGAVVVRAECDIACAADNCFDIYFTVEDTGIGMAPHTLARVFESFTIGEHFMTKRHSGAGVGLSIVRTLVEMLGGTIQASSTPGEGTSVTFHLPFRPPTEQEAEQDAAPVFPEETEPRALSPNANAHILVVEDDPVNMLAVEAVLRRGGFTVDKACNGAEALEALRLHPADLVLMDIQMPVMDGLRATSHIRNGEVPGVDRRIPVIALTAYATPGNIDRFQRWGIDDVIAKPFVSSHLKDVLLRHLSG